MDRDDILKGYVVKRNQEKVGRYGMVSLTLHNMRGSRHGSTNQVSL